MKSHTSPVLEAARDFSSGDSYRVLKTKRTSDGHSNRVIAPKQVTWQSPATEWKRMRIQGGDRLGLFLQPTAAVD